MLRVNDAPISDNQRESLGYYIRAEGRDITPWFVLRLYYSRLTSWSCWLLLVALAIKVFAPVDTTITLRAAMLSIVAALLCGLLALSLRSSFASVEHWRLLQRVLDWDAVHRLHDSEPHDDGG